MRKFWTHQPPSSGLNLCHVLAEEYESILTRPSRPEGEGKGTGEDPAEPFRVLSGEIQAAEVEIHGKHHQKCLPRIYRQIHQIPDPLKPSALCLSGGGIRSASIGLGVLQGLAKRGRLADLDYLSTVSGGGYIGSWLMAWIHRDPRGAPGVIEKLAGSRSASSGVAETERPVPEEPYGGEPREIRHLRAYSNYLTPKLGLLSADTWTSLAIYLRNLFLNWLVIGPILSAALLLPILCLSAMVVATAGPSPEFSRFLAVSAAGLLATGIAYVALHLPASAPSKEGGTGSQGGFLAACLLPLITGHTFLAVYWAQVRYAPPATIDWPFLPALPGLQALVAFGAVVHLLGWLGYFMASVLEARGGLARRLVEAAWFAFTGALLGAATWAIAYHGYPRLASLVSGSAYELYETRVFVSLATPVLLFLSALVTTLFAGVFSRWLTDDDQEWLARAGAWILIYCVGWFLFSGLVLVAGPILAEKLENREELRALLGGLGAAAGLVTAVVGFTSKLQGQPEEQGRGSKLAGVALAVAAPIFALLLLVALSQAAWWIVEQWAGPTEFGATLLLWGCLLAFGCGMARVININTFSLHGMYRNRLIRAYLGASNADRVPHPFTGFDPADNIELYRLQRSRLQQEDLSAEPAMMMSLVEALTTSEDPVSARIRANASSASLERMRRYSASFDNYHKASLAVLDELNAALDDPVLRAAARAHPRVVELARRDPTLKAILDSEAPEHAELPRVLENRRILEAVYGFKSREPYKPLHVVNIALNLVGGRDLAWQQRRATLFTATPHHVGAHDVRLGYRRSRDYGKAFFRGRKRAITLGTAVTISGAAASPNMGYYSSSVLGFLMTLVNARLGSWKGNPGAAGKKTFSKAHPRYSVGPLFAELFGLTNAENKWVYLSDGGHFDNLGLYAMILRRCHEILVIDASADPSRRFDNLGNAIHKIRVDLGIPIHFSEGKFFSGPAGEALAYWTTGTIDYAAVDEGAPPGSITYVKPAVHGGEPVDVISYKQAHADFPHESTKDQWFSEAQFETYRMLGRHIGESLYPDSGSGGEEKKD